jgi:hypothetical protein
MSSTSVTGIVCWPAAADAGADPAAKDEHGHNVMDHAMHSIDGLDWMEWLQDHGCPYGTWCTQEVMQGLQELRHWVSMLHAGW